MEQTQKDNIIKKLIDTHTTVSTMESCTSGMIASTITDTEGASAIFPGGYVTYLNETKIFIGVEEEIIRLTRMRDRIIGGIMEEIPCAYLNGDPDLRLPTNINIGFGGFEGQAPNLLVELDRKGIVVSTGSACSSDGNRTSHVLAAIGRNQLQAIGALRITLGRFTAEEDADYLLCTLPAAVNSLNSLWTR